MCYSRSLIPIYQVLIVVALRSSSLSDRIRRKDYDTKLRIAMQNEAEAAPTGGIVVEETHMFWTACSTCRLLLKFERKYLGHILVCPSCKMSFEAVEAVEEDAGTERLQKEKEAVGGRCEE
ncbi:OLC1v1026641C1 [Oldenlandia corymbosa var. corymbosa]|uniref:OLC1v1026641C1 n=1 Tax=Oldenlandia corymbosa var. corymbosa TaxID=529605 RepID=A0AAV1C9J4_OLDCO|nr:OLC1v1026641C1 [Oldenlandia corymbosa var. corymbosa]